MLYVTQSASPFPRLEWNISIRANCRDVSTVNKSGYLRINFVIMCRINSLRNLWILISLLAILTMQISNCARPNHPNPPSHNNDNSSYTGEIGKI